MDRHSVGLASNRRLPLLIIAGSAIMFAVILAVGAFLFMDRLRSDQTAGGPANALRREVNPPAVVADQQSTPGAISIRAVDYGGFDPVLTAVVSPPDGAAEMQVGLDPTFRTVAWRPVTDEVRLGVTNHGYQVVYARFRNGAGTVSAASVAGVDVDSTRDQATSSNEGLHRASWLRPASPTELVVRIEAGRLDRGSLELYDLANPAESDDIRGRETQSIVVRDGEPVAESVSKRNDVVRRFDQLIGRPLATEGLAGGSWSLSSPTAPGFASPVEAAVVAILAEPTAGGIGRDDEWIWPRVYDVALRFSPTLEPGHRYDLVPPADLVAPVSLDFDDRSTVTPTVHVNQVGFAPNDVKVAVWGGLIDGIGGSAVVDGKPFVVVDAETGEVHHQDQGVVVAAGDEMGHGDLSGGGLVVELDFSALREEGRFQVCVEGVGCSYPFTISAEVWTDLAVTVARAAYHQRSGTDLGAPFTSVDRPAGYRPDAGATVFGSEHTQLEMRLSGGTGFDELVAKGTASEVPTAWGGHFDAGDWDRRINHLWYTRTTAHLLRWFPEEFAGLTLNIPESENAVPDLLDEGLWSLDLYRRMQAADGGIRGGVEASHHPPANSTSWTDDLATFAFSPDPWSSFLYASVAAEVAVTLQPYDRARADDYLESALAAYRWAADEIDRSSFDDDQLAAIRGQHNVAAAALLLATGESAYHEDFMATADYLNGGERAMSCHRHLVCDAAWLYLEADPALTDPAIRQDLTDRFVQSADAILDAAQSTRYGWTTEHPSVPLIWGLGASGAPHSSGLLKAFHLTGDTKYRDAVVRSAGVSLGANPKNRVLITGVGREPVRNPLIVDILHGGLPVWPGTPVYGPHQFVEDGPEAWAVEFFLRPGGANPDPLVVPYLWKWYDVSNLPFLNEFTLHQSHSETLLAFATLAATD